MRHVHDEETMQVRIFTDYTNTRSPRTSSWPLVGGVRFDHRGITVGNRHETVLLGNILIDILNMAVCGLVAVVVGIFAEKVGGLVVVNKLVRCSTRRSAASHIGRARDGLGRGVGNIRDQKSGSCPRNE